MMTTGSQVTTIILGKDHDDVLLLKDINKIIVALGITSVRTLMESSPHFAMLKQQLNYECNREE